MVSVTFIDVDGGERTVTGTDGQSLMSVALSAGIEEIMGDCGGGLACATCHVHIMPDWIVRLEQPSEAELTMLDMAVDPDETSRLSCQIKLSDALDGITVRLPAAQF